MLNFNNMSMIYGLVFINVLIHQHLNMSLLEKLRMEVIGMHNWFSYIQRNKNNFDYLGFIRPKGRPRGYDSPLSHNDSRLVTIQFEWDGALKPVSTSFIGTTPEFELKIYFSLFLWRRWRQINWVRTLQCKFSLP